jgi:hypothetical protein
MYGSQNIILSSGINIGYLFLVPNDLTRRKLNHKIMKKIVIIPKEK